MVANTSSGYCKEKLLDSVLNLACRGGEFVYLIFFPYLYLVMTVLFSFSLSTQMSVKFPQNREFVGWGVIWRPEIL